MRKELLVAFGLFLLFNSCKKKDKDFLNWPDPIYKLDFISVITPSGATVRHDFVYSGSTLTTVNDFDIYNTKILYHEFIYDGDQLVKIDTYRTSGGSPVLERRLMIYYAGPEVKKIEQYLSPNGVPFLSSFITYSYDGEGKMIQKKSYIQLSGGPLQVQKSDYTYDVSGNIISIKEESQGTTLTGVDFYPTYSNFLNKLRINNPPLSAFIWYLLDPNFFKNGFEEVLLYSKNVISGTKRDIGGLIHDYTFQMVFDNNNNIIRIMGYPQLYNLSYPALPVVNDMHLHYVIKSHY